MIQWVWGEGQDSTGLTISQVMLILPNYGLHIDSQGFNTLKNFCAILLSLRIMHVYTHTLIYTNTEIDILKMSLYNKEHVLLMDFLFLILKKREKYISLLEKK